MNNTMPNAHAPTVPRDLADADFKAKQNFGEQFDRNVFSGTKKVPELFKNSRTVRDRAGRIQYKKQARVKGEPKQSFLNRHKLDRYSEPIEFFDAFMPQVNNNYGAYLPSISQWTNWTNTKAIMMGAGDTIYRGEWRSFTTKEVRQILGTYIIHGLAPTPRLEYKFYPQSHDPVTGNDFVAANMGKNALRRLHHFKCFFACQNPVLPTPDRNLDPLHKVKGLVSWITKIGGESWALGKSFAIDEQTIGFQGQHIHKLRISYKKEGDGFQCDALCQDGFTFAVYFRNEPPPAQYIKKGMSPLHARVMWLFDKVEEKYHNCWLDNLYMSAKLAKISFTHKNKVMVSGVTRKSGRGIPFCVLQEEKKLKRDIIKVCGTVKAAVLKGDDTCPDLVCTSVYDTKPVHFMSTICNSIKWIIKKDGYLMWPHKVGV